MSTAALTSKGQITIPAAVRSALGVDTGDRVEFVPIADGRFEIIAATVPVTALKGRIAKPKKPVSIEAMNATIARRAAAEPSRVRHGIASYDLDGSGLRP